MYMSLQMKGISEKYFTGLQCYTIMNDLKFLIFGMYIIYDILVTQVFKSQEEKNALLNITC